MSFLLLVCVQVGYRYYREMAFFFDKTFVRLCGFVPVFTFILILKT